MDQNSKNLRVKTITGFLWRFLERVGAQGVQLIVSIILARLLAPELFGTITLISVFTTILSTFVDSGFGNALIQKKDADDLDFSSVFYFNITICVILYLIMFVCAPLIARFYNSDSLTAPIRVISLTLIVSGVKNVQSAYVSRTMQFKRFFFATLGGTLGAAALGIWMAYAGFGIWALVAQYLFNNAFDTFILWLTVKWRPKWMFSFERLKALFSYGWKILASSLIDTTYGQLRQLIIGKFYSPSSLAYYDRGNSFPFAIVNNVNSSINSVLFPVMSSVQDDVENLKRMTRRAITISSYIMWPLMMGLAACAEPFVKLLLTDKWLPCVPFLRIFCISYAFYPIHSSNLNAIKALGRSDLFLKLEIIKKCVGLLIIIVSMQFGVLAMAYGVLIGDALSQIINSWPNRKLLHYPYEEQLKDITPAIIISLVMFGIVWSVQLLHLSNLFTLFLQIPTGIFVYAISSKLFRLESFNYCMLLFKSFLKRP